MQNRLPVLFLRPVGEVEPEDVDAVGDQCPQDFGRGRCGSDGGDDLCASAPRVRQPVGRVGYFNDRRFWQNEANGRRGLHLQFSHHEISPTSALA